MVDKLRSAGTTPNFADTNMKWKSLGRALLIVVTLNKKAELDFRPKAVKLSYYPVVKPAHWCRPETLPAGGAIV